MPHLVSELKPEQFRKISPDERKIVEALRSGKFMQGKGRLVNVSSSGENQFAYCCLGVACVVNDMPVCGDNGPASNNYYHFEDPGVNNKYPANWEIAYLPSNLCRKLGWTREGHLAGSVIIRSDPYPRDTLVTCNDNFYSFKEIATIIESGLVAIYPL